MCSGHLDPKLLTREVEERLRGMPKQHDIRTEPAEPGRAGGWATVLATLRATGLLGKEKAHG